MAKRKGFTLAQTQLASKVKRANQRLRELEKQNLTKSPAYKAAERLALNKPEIMGTTSKSEIKFSTNIRSLSASDQKELEKAVDRFLAAESSTTKGTKAVANRARDWYRQSAIGKKRSENQKAEGVTQYPGIPLDDIFDDDLDNWLDLWGTAAAKQMTAAYGSDFTEFIINNQIALKGDFSGDNYDDALQFIEGKLGEPALNIIGDIETEWQDAEGSTPWSWNDIFTE